MRIKLMTVNGKRVMHEFTTEVDDFKNDEYIEKDRRLFKRDSEMSDEDNLVFTKVKVHHL